MIDGNFESSGETLSASRGYSDLCKRDWNGKKVAIKALRFHLKGDRSERTKVTALFVDDPLGDLSTLIETL